jgi:hypothetical protein
MALGKAPTRSRHKCELGVQIGSLAEGNWTSLLDPLASRLVAQTLCADGRGKQRRVIGEQLVRQTADHLADLGVGFGIPTLEQFFEPDPADIEEPVRKNSFSPGP